jgi:hypothetical protein
VSVGGHDVDLSAHFLELGVVVSGIFHFGRAVEGECSGHKNEHIPLTLEGFVGDGDKLAIVESFVFKVLDLGIDKGHE